MDMEVSVQGSGFGEDGMSVASVEVVAGPKVHYPKEPFCCELPIDCKLVLLGSLGSPTGYRYRIYYGRYWWFLGYFTISAGPKRRNHQKGG